jgi:hypothetical protein
MNKTDRSLKSTLSFAAAANLAVGAATAQVASESSFPGSAMIDSSGSYQSEVQACMSGKTQQSREDCLKEARNANAEKQRGRLEDYAANATSRCEIHGSAEDRAACQARILGMGRTDGSVAGGGLLRESETVILPSGQHSVTVQPQTSSDTIVLVPSTRTLGSN